MRCIVQILLYHIARIVFKQRNNVIPFSFILSIGINEDWKKIFNTKNDIGSKQITSIINII